MNRRVKKHQPVIVPELKHDAYIQRRFKVGVAPEGMRERRIVANLVAYLDSHGFRCVAVCNNEERIECTDAKAAMEEIFKVAVCHLRVCVSSSPYAQIFPSQAEYWVRLVCDNGSSGANFVDDWQGGDNVGFDACMAAFDYRLYT